MSEQMTGEPYFADVPAPERQWAMFAHLSALVAIWLGGMAFLGPLLVWLIKKDEMRFVDDQGKEALNFQLNILLLKVATVIIGVPLGVVTLGIGFVLLFAILAGLVVLDIVLAIVAAVEVNGGGTYRYPLIIRFVK
jgi:uncharacterized Tic20 family protein